MLKPMNSPNSPLKPIHSKWIGWGYGTDVTARKEGAPVDWEPRGHDIGIGQHNKVGVCIVCTSMVVESGHQHRMDGWSLLPKIDIPC